MRVAGYLLLGSCCLIILFSTYDCDCSLPIANYCKVNQKPVRKDSFGATSNQFTTPLLHLQLRRVLKNHQRDTYSTQL